jgi:hypothetical protein
MTDRQQLLGWIASSQRTQRRLAVVVVALVAVSAGLVAWRKPVGTFALLVTAAIGVIGYWVTYAHITDWRDRLAKLRRSA